MFVFMFWGKHKQQPVLFRICLCLCLCFWENINVNLNISTSSLYKTANQFIIPLRDSYMIRDFSDDYKIAKLLFIEKELKRLPNYHRGSRNNLSVVREYGSDNVVIRTYTLNNSKNKEIGQIADLRAHYQELRKRLLSSLKVSPSEYHIQLSAGYYLSKDDWDKMKSQSNPKEIKSDLWFENIHMRSRFELNTAIILKSLGLEFKYEPAVWFKGKCKYPDFVVYLPEFEVCFIIECMGMIGDSGYDNEAVDKIRLFTENKLIPYRDFLVLGGTSDFIPTKDWVLSAIVSMVNSIASECVFPLSKNVEEQPQVVVYNTIPADLASLLEKEWEF